MSEEKKSKKQEKYELVEVPTQFGLAFRTPDEKVLSQEQVLVELLNMVSEIRNRIG